jgi:hypothetical protein
MSSGTSALNPSSVEQAATSEDGVKPASSPANSNGFDTAVKAARSLGQPSITTQDAPLFNRNHPSNHRQHDSYFADDAVLNLQVPSANEEDWMVTKSLSLLHVNVRQPADHDSTVLPARQALSTSSQDEPITPLASTQPPQQLLSTTQWEPSVEAVARVRPSVRAKLQERLSSEEDTPPTLRKSKPTAISNSPAVKGTQQPSSLTYPNCNPPCCSLSHPSHTRCCPPSIQAQPQSSSLRPQFPVSPLL